MMSKKKHSKTPQRRTAVAKAPAGASGKNFARVMQGLSEAADFAAGKAVKGARVHVPAEVDVKAIRTSLGLTQTQFAQAYGFTVGAVRDWEQGRRQPEASARILLKVIEKRPDVVAEILGAAA